MEPRELKVLEKIKPTKIEAELVFSFVQKLLDAAHKIAGPFCAYPEIVGSIAKDTFLRNGYDIDLFIVFKEKLTREKLEEYGLLVGVTIAEELKGTYNIKYAEHPYVRVTAGIFKIDVVPCYEIARGGKIISAVDRSPLHTRYVREHLTGYMKDHARILKYFCKQIGIYGADAEHEGVSGYLCELLIIEYGTFGGAIKKISEMGFHSFIDVEELTSEKEAKKKFSDALIVIDPTDRDRNVASPLSAQNFLKLKMEARKYLEAKSFPVLKRRTKRMLVENLKKERGTSFAGVIFSPPDMVPENLYPQLRRFERHLARYLHENDFSVLRHFSWTDEEKIAVIIIEVEKSALSDRKKQAGPAIFSSETENFLKKYMEEKYKPYIEKNQFFVTTKRRFLSIEAAIEAFLEERREEIPEKLAELDLRVLKERQIAGLVNANNDLNSYLVEKIFRI